MNHSPGSARCCAGCQPSGHPRLMRQHHGWTQRRWSRSSRTVTPCLCVLLGLRVHARVGAREIECRHGGELVAVHERQQGRFGCQRSLDHYLELLARKPGALAGSLALSQERERGAWPSVFDELWGKITERYGSSEAARQMVDVLMLAREHSASEVELAVRGALTAGAHDGRAVAVLVLPRRPRATAGA